MARPARGLREPFNWQFHVNALILLHFPLDQASVARILKCGSELTPSLDLILA